MTAAVERLGATARRAIADLLEDPIFEMIPLRDALEQARHLPAGARVSVTASPNKSLEESLDLAADLTGMGFRVTPHLAGRMTRDVEHLRLLLGRMDELGISTAFVVGGDADVAGTFPDGLALLEGMAALGHSFEVGVPCYPEGHPRIPDRTLGAALAAKQPHASWMTSQMCFDPDAVLAWTRSARRSGLSLPLVLGLAGVADRVRLLRISTRIGVGRSLSFLRKNTGLLSAFARPGGYDPAELLLGLGEHLANPTLGIIGCHIYTFNQCQATEEWRRSFRHALAGGGV